MPVKAVKTAELPEMNPDSEREYDAEIDPLMDKIIELCQRHRIPMFCQFQIGQGEEHDPGENARFCTMRLAFRNESPNFCQHLNLNMATSSDLRAQCAAASELRPE